MVATNKNLMSLMMALAQIFLMLFSEKNGGLLPYFAWLVYKLHIIYLELLDEQRRLLNKINHHYEFDEELIRKYLFLRDMEKFKIRKRLSVWTVINKHWNRKVIEKIDWYFGRDIQQRLSWLVVLFGLKMRPAKAKIFH